MLDVAHDGHSGLLRRREVPAHAASPSHGGIYWLKDAKEVPDTQVLNYDYGDFMLVWELRSFARLHPMEGTAAGTAFYGTRRGR